MLKRIVGFAQFGIRLDYVEGSKHRPCGYLEGIVVHEKYRRKGVAKTLVETGESWCRDKNCLEFASDCEIDNVASLLFHESLNFREVSRNSHYVKKLS